MKKCTKCGVKKSLDSYYKDNQKADNKRPQCKSCENMRMKELRKTEALTHIKRSGREATAKQRSISYGERTNKSKER